MNKNRILLITVGIIILIITSFFVLHLINNMNTDQYKVDEEYSSKQVNEPENIINNVEVISEPEQTTSEAITEDKEDITEVKEPLEPIETIEPVEDPIIEEKPKEQEDSDRETIGEITEAEPETPQTPEPTLEEATTDSAIEPIDTGNDWVDEKVNEHIDEIADEDIDAGASLSEKLDKEIISGFFEDGLTDEEKVELKSYLLENLSDEQYNSLIGLFNKYNYILD